jgi:hypothetical protein
MRELFPGYYRPTDAEFEALWRECLFGFDANVLLNVYRYNEQARERLFSILEGLGERVWLPHQAALEYQRNRVGVIQEQAHAYAVVARELDAALSSLKKSLAPYDRHPGLQIDELIGAVQQGVQRAKDRVKETESEHPDLMVEDRFRERLDRIFARKVGPPYADEGLITRYEKIEARYAAQKPPGFKDAKKAVPDRYGDALIWFQLLDHAGAEKIPIVFVTDDAKSDWWLESKGKTIGPSPDLMAEMMAEAGVAFYLYSIPNFLQRAQEFLKLREEQAVIEEARRVQQENAEREAASIVLNLGSLEAVRPDERSGTGSIAEQWAAHQAAVDASLTAGLGLADYVARMTERDRASALEAATQLGRRLQEDQWRAFARIGEPRSAFDVARLAYPKFSAGEQIAKTLSDQRLAGAMTAAEQIAARLAPDTRPAIEGIGPIDIAGMPQRGATRKRAQRPGRKQEPPASAEAEGEREEDPDRSE